ncbi:MAG TPA: S8 family serine peptidase [bacterium]|nr:S8 family serine peptidase [bacterium]
MQRNLSMRSSLILVLVLLTTTSIGFAKGVTYRNNGSMMQLQEVPNQYVVGVRGNAEKATQLAAEMRSSRALGIQIQGIVETKAIGGGLIVVKTDPSVSGTKSVSAVNKPSQKGVAYVYPVYKDPSTGLLIYPQPEVVVKVAEGVDIFRLAQRHDLTVVRPLLYTDDQFVLRLDSTRSPFAVSNRLWSDPDVIWANPNFAHQIKLNFQPNDELYPSQWHLNNTGQYGGMTGADIAAEAAWDLQMPSEDVVIGIVDSGMDLGHPDLNIYTNPVEQAGQSGVDDDGNGLIDDIHGWDFANNDNDPNPTNANEIHATAVAGCAAARGNNQIGVVGVSFGTPVLPVRLTFDRPESVPEEEWETTRNTIIADSIRYAAKHADVVNNSWGGSTLSDIVREALDFATSDQGKRGDKRVPVLFSSGNAATSFSWFEGTENIPAGSHTVEFVYEKDDSGSAGDDTVWIESIQLSGHESYCDMVYSASSGTFLEGMQGGGDVPFDVQESEMTTLGFVFQSGEIGDNQTSSLIWEFETSELTHLLIHFRIRSEKGKDVLHVLLDGQEYPGRIDGGMPEPEEPAQVPLEPPFSGLAPSDQSTYLVFQSTDPLEAGAHTISFIYQKDESGSEGDDAARIYDGYFIDPETNEYIGDLFLSLYEEAFPEGVEGGGDQPFEIVPSNVPNYELMYQSGTIEDNQSSQLVWNVDLPQSGHLAVEFQVSTEADYDLFWIEVDGEQISGQASTSGEDDPGGDSTGISGNWPSADNVAPIDGESLHPNVINIGASTLRDTRTCYSQWGPELHFLAPGEKNIVTTDVTVPEWGYSPDSAYALDFSGTSAACPIASGIVALVLAANPDLTVEEIFEVLKETADKIGPLEYDENGFNEEYGYGRLNAAAAVQYALDLREVPVKSWDLY